MGRIQNFDESSERSLLYFNEILDDNIALSSSVSCLIQSGYTLVDNQSTFMCLSRFLYFNRIFNQCYLHHCRCYECLSRSATLLDHGTVCALRDTSSLTFLQLLHFDPGSVQYRPNSLEKSQYFQPGPSANNFPSDNSFAKPRRYKIYVSIQNN